MNARTRKSSLQLQPSHEQWLSGSRWEWAPQPGWWLTSLSHKLSQGLPAYRLWRLSTSRSTSLRISTRMIHYPGLSVIGWPGTVAPSLASDLSNGNSSWGAVALLGSDMKRSHTQSDTSTIIHVHIYMSLYDLHMQLHSMAYVHWHVYI